MSNPLALIVDDEPDIRELLDITLGRMKIDSLAAADLESARKLLSERSFDLCLTDMRLPDGSGLELVELIGKQLPQLPVAVITAHGNMESAVQALKSGAFDFVSKPVDLQVLRRLVQTALRLEQGDKAGRSTEIEAPSGPVLLGDSHAIKQIRTLIERLARSQAPVYISGESGTGKELAARLIHRQGPRSDKSFIAVNCGAIPQELMESEFFGHTKGSFTGAVSDKEGLFQAADGGTLLLDEVADLPMPMQVKLLRAIQEKRIRPVGAQKEVPVDVRIISATHKDLGTLVEQGEFRQDLFYRINVIELSLPPLRERRADIPLLAGQMLARITSHAEAPMPDIRPDAMEKLRHYSYPGNVRELENILERATALCEDGRITAEDLLLPENRTTPAESQGDMPLETYLEELERAAIIKALEETHWNRTAAAKKLGISFRALRYRLRKLNLDTP